MLGARNRHDVLALGEQPRQRELTGRAVFLARQFRDLLHQSEIMADIFRSEAGVPLARIIVGERLRIFDSPGKEPAPQRRIGDESDAKLPRRLQRLFALGAIEQ